MIRFNARIPIQIQPLFLLSAAVIGWLSSQSFEGTAIWIMIIFFSVLIHEYGHALTALYFGQRARIDLVAFGGLTTRTGPNLTPWKHFIVILAGPLASLLLAGGALFFLKYMPKGSLLQEVLYLTMLANFFWAGLNLLPVQPLDGGKLTMILLERLFGFRGLKISFFLGTLIAFLIALYAIFQGSLLIGSIFFLFMYESGRSFWAVRSITACDHDEVFQKQLERAKENLDRGQVEEAKKELESLIQQSGSGILNTTAKEVLGRIIASEGDLQTAFDLLHPIQDALSLETLKVLHDLSLQLSNWKEAAALGEKLYRLRPDGELAFQNALAEAHLKQPDRMAGWLMRAKKEGFPRLEEALKNKPFTDYENLGLFPKSESR